MRLITLDIPPNTVGRLDVYLAQHIPDSSRSAIQRLAKEGLVRVDSVPAKAGHMLKGGEVVSVRIPESRPTDLQPEPIPLDVVFEDEHLMVVNKPSGMVVHPGAGVRGGTLANAVLAHSDELSELGGVERPGIVHRLDKDTSGLLVVAKTDAAFSSLQSQIQERRAERRYLALVWGDPRFEEAEADAPIGRHPTDRQRMAVIREVSKYTAREARTHLTVRERFSGFAMIEAKLDTGRTHQIRVHCSFIGHPVVGDSVYGGVGRALPSTYSRKDSVELTKLLAGLHGQVLHAYSLEFDHPITGDRMRLEAPVPEEMAGLLSFLRRDVTAHEL